MDSLQGQLLIASPHMQDPNFARSVVLLIQHTEEGAFGVVLNRPINKTIKELWAEVEEPLCENARHLNLGGPVSGPLMALHTDAPLGELEVVPGVFFSAQKDHLEDLVQHNPSQLKLFVGHSGWAGGQLESELEQGAWLLLPATSELVFYAEDELWQQAKRRVGRNLMVDGLRIKHVPADPSWN